MKKYIKYIAVTLLMLYAANNIYDSWFIYREIVVFDGAKSSYRAKISGRCNVDIETEHLVKVSCLVDFLTFRNHTLILSKNSVLVVKDEGQARLGRYPEWVSY